MATAGNRSPSRPVISIAEHQRTWDSDTPQVAPVPDENSEGSEITLTVLPAVEGEPSAGANDQPSAAQQPAGPLPLDATFIGSISPLSGAAHGPSPATTGICVPQDSSVGQDHLAFLKAPTADAAIQKETPGDLQPHSIGAIQGAQAKRGENTAPPASTLDTGTLKETPRGLQARGTEVLQGAQEKRDFFTSPLIQTADAATLRETPQDLRAVVSGGAAAAQLVSVAAQETHIAPLVHPALGPVVRYRAERATVADEGAAPEQGAEQGDAELVAARVDVLVAGKPVRPSLEQLASVARSASEQGTATNADVELGSSVLPTDRSVSGLADAPLRAAAAVPLPSHQVAGQIVATALAVPREEAQPIGTLAAKPLAPSVVKILRLELQPVDLGTITIRMSLKQDALDIRVEASRYDTARMLQRDQDSLAKILTGAGYRIDGMAIITPATDGAAVPDGRSQAFLPSSTPQHWGPSQHDSRSSSGRPNAEPDPRSSRGKQNDDNDKSGTARGAGGDLYV
jgi:hypothetical protein